MKDLLQMSNAVLGGLVIAGGMGIVEHKFGDTAMWLFYAGGILIYSGGFLIVVNSYDKKPRNKSKWILPLTLIKNDRKK